MGFSHPRTPDPLRNYREATKTACSVEKRREPLKKIGSTPCALPEAKIRKGAVPSTRLLVLDRTVRKSGISPRHREERRESGGKENRKADLRHHTTKKKEKVRVSPSPHSKGGERRGATVPANFKEPGFRDRRESGVRRSGGFAREEGSMEKLGTR